MLPLSKVIAQSSNERTTVVYPKSDSTYLDSLSIVPGSWQHLAFFQGKIETTYQVQVAPWEALLICSAPYPDSIRITYSVFPYSFVRKYYHKDPQALEQADLDLTPLELKTTATYDPFSELEGLNYSGSLVRGLSFGNNQDVVLNSSFNLQMSGMLKNDVEISAAITDNNIPIQPEGNTQQLQEFDKVFIRLSKGKQSLLVGDFDMLRPDDYFLNYYKRSQGLAYNGAFQMQNGAEWTSELGAAVARGVYTRQTVDVIEGNQGPYKLKGNNGEVFIIILAGTERVWMDGILLTRGAENDYIIDYNAGEIIFTPRQLINKDKRIQIEFEYSDRSYFRSILLSNNKYESADKKWKAYLNIYTEQDGKNQPLDQTLDSTSRSVLQNIGDSIQAAYIPGFDTLTYDAGRIMYRLTDSLGVDTVFVFSSDPESAMYVLSFTELGLNKGNYILSSNLANGRVYKWVAPVAGVPQGSAEPVILLKAPLSRQMITSGVQYSANDKTAVGAEVAWSKQDVNTFSDVNDADDDGIGIHLNARNKQKTNKGLDRTTGFAYEYISSTFQFIERYRPVEFNRDWNLPLSNPTNEHYSTLDFSLGKAELWKLQLASSVFIREDAYTGFRQAGNFHLENKQWELTSGGSIVSATTDTSASSYLRPDITLVKKLPNLGDFQAGTRYWSEHNSVRQADSLLAGSFYFDEFVLFVKSPDSTANTIQTECIIRYDGLPEAGSFKRANEGLTWKISGQVNKKSTNRLSWLFTYRQLNVLDTALSFQADEKALLGRIQHSYVAGTGWLTSDIFYEIGTGQEPKREFTYLEVEPGQGAYSWIDYNADGIPQLNEFEVAIYADQATYIQVFIPTSEYIQANVSQFNYALAINPRAAWNNKGGLKEAIARLSTLSTLQLNRKVLDDGSSYSYLPVGMVADTALVSSNIFWQNTLYFNRISSIFGMDYTWLNTLGKQVLVNGPETREKREHKLQSRYKIFDPLVLNFVATSGIRRLASDAFTDRSYTTPYYSIEPKITFIKGAVYRISLSYNYKESYNSEGLETLQNHTAQAEIRYNVPGNSSVTSRLSYALVDFFGDAETPISFAMLEGLQNGNNALWNVHFDKKLSQVLQLTLAYDGRKTGSASIVHTGSVQMRAVF